MSLEPVDPVALDLEGQHDHTVDDKGRVSIPAEFRTSMSLAEGDELVVTRHFNQRCLLVFPPVAWDAFKAQLEEADPRIRPVLRRVVVGSARRVKADRLGRIQIPQVLRQFAQLDGKCFIVGQGDRVEMWDVSVWNEMFDPACLAEHDLTGLNL
ncbi:MAG: division/cell wall cluster transcriptional repressor MraZ [Myxococcales bacterium]|nr:division/cell wall cluster transcriptional repressor MraZ [Myxococcales bacterium]